MSTTKPLPSFDSPSLEKGFVVFAGLEHRTFIVLFCSLLPWIVVSLFATNSWVAMHLLGYAVLVSVVGYAFVSAVLPGEARIPAIVLSPSAGILALSAITAFWSRLGFRLLGVSVVWLVLGLGGAFCLWRDRLQLKKASIDYGPALIAFSTVICGFCFVPSAFYDASFGHDGSYNWFSVDTQIYHSMVASVFSSDGPPKMAGTWTADLYYHFAPFAPAAVISRLSGIETGDAFARVTRGVEQWALVFSCLGLGTMLSIQATGKAFGGIMSVIGLFFYGSLVSLLSDAVRDRVVSDLPILFEPQGVSLTTGCPFNGILLGASMLHGMVLVTVVLGLCIAGLTAGAFDSWRVVMVLIFPAIVVPFNLLGGLYCLGVVPIFLFWAQLANGRSWYLMGIMIGLFFGAYLLMGFGHSPHLAGRTIQWTRLTMNWWSFVAWFFFGLGIRIIGLGWVSNPLRSPLAALISASFIGLMLLSWICELRDGNERYGIHYLQSIMSIFAFSRLPYGFWRGASRDTWVREWLSLAMKGLLLFISAGVLIAILSYAIHRTSGIPLFRYRLFASLVMLLLIVSLLAIMKGSCRYSNGVAVLVTGVLMIGFLGWMPPWLKYRTGGHQYNITLKPGEVRGLQRFHEIAGPCERFATNKHTPTGGSRSNVADSYAYGTFSGHPVLLEGYVNGGEETIPGFKTLLHDNDLLFTTKSASVLRDIAQSYRIRWLLLRPGTDIALPKPLPPWLAEQTGCGDLKVYQIN